MADSVAFKVISAMHRLTLSEHRVEVHSTHQISIWLGTNEKDLAWFHKHYPVIENRPPHITDHGRRAARPARARSRTNPYARSARPAAPDTWCYSSGGATVYYERPHECGGYRSQSPGGERPTWWCFWCGGELSVTRARELGLIA